MGAASLAQKAASIAARASAGKTSTKKVPWEAVLASSGSSVAPRARLKRQMGASSSNIPFFDLFAGCTPPPIQEIREPATLSTGREPVWLGTIVGWSSAMRHFSESARSPRMTSRASANDANRGATVRRAPSTSNRMTQIAQEPWGCLSKRNRSQRSRSSVPASYSGLSGSDERRLHLLVIT